MRISTDRAPNEYVLLAVCRLYQSDCAELKTTDPASVSGELYMPFKGRRRRGCLQIIVNLDDSRIECVRGCLAILSMLVYIVVL